MKASGVNLPIVFFSTVVLVIIIWCSSIWILYLSCQFLQKSCWDFFNFFSITYWDLGCDYEKKHNMLFLSPHILITSSTSSWLAPFPHIQCGFSRIDILTIKSLNREHGVLLHLFRSTSISTFYSFQSMGLGNFS